MAKVRHVRLRSQTIHTSQGKLTLDDDGVFEASEEQATILCDENKYAGTFQRVSPAPEPPKVEAEEEVVSEAVSEEVVQPLRRKKKKKKTHRVAV